MNKRSLQWQDSGIEKQVFQQAKELGKKKMYEGTP